MIITFYRIYCKDTNITDCYVGHTKNFKKRKQTHKDRCKTKTYNIYTKIRENGGWENWIMEELENTNFDDKREAVIREQELILEHNAKLNTYDATLNIIKLRDTANKIQKNYYEKNKEKILEKAREVYAKKNNQLLST